MYQAEIIWVDPQKSLSRYMSNKFWLDDSWLRRPNKSKCTHKETIDWFVSELKDGKVFVVNVVSDKQEFKIVDGFHRFAAMILEKWKKIPVKVHENNRGWLSGILQTESDNGNLDSFILTK